MTTILCRAPSRRTVPTLDRSRGSTSRADTAAATPRSSAGITRPRRQNRRGKPLPLSGVGVDTLMVDPRCGHRHSTRRGQHLTLAVLTTSRYPCSSTSNGVGVDVHGDLGGQHLAGTVADDLIEQRMRPAPVLVWRNPGRELPEHGRSFPASAPTPVLIPVKKVLTPQPGTISPRPSPAERTGSTARLGLTARLRRASVAASAACRSSPALPGVLGNFGESILLRLGVRGGGRERRADGSRHGGWFGLLGMSGPMVNRRLASAE
jgi:hypothetical protein